MARIKLTAGRIRDFAADKTQSFLWDSDTPGLAVRATAPGKRNAEGGKAYIFQGRLVTGQDVRITIGDVKAWDIEQARKKAKTLQVLIDDGKDPRQVAADEIAAEQSKREEESAATQAAESAAIRRQISVGEVWGKYIEARKAKWSERHLFDHCKLMKPERDKDGKTLTAGVLASLAPLPLAALTPKRVAEWLEEETPRRATQAALAFRLLRAFINWCNEQDEYQGIAAPDACARKVSRAHLPKAAAKKDCLQREQLRLWFESVQRIHNLTISTYLQGLLITGARRNELTGLRWKDVDFQWNSLNIRDKVEGERRIPLTPYFASLLLELKNKNEISPPIRRLKAMEEKGKEWKPSPWVFSSPTSKTGRLEEPSIAHRKAIAAAGLPPVSLHGLRRSFGTLAEWVEVPTGIVAQIMGHKPSATAEKHYRERPLDLLRLWHSKIEAWILEQAGIEQQAENEKPGLRVITAT